MQKVFLLVLCVAVVLAGKNGSDNKNKSGSGEGCKFKACKKGEPLYPIAAMCIMAQAACGTIGVDECQQFMTTCVGTQMSSCEAWDYLGAFLSYHFPSLFHVTNYRGVVRREWRLH